VKFTFSSGDDGMGWMEFISSLIGSLAWPAVVLTIVLVFRQPISKLIANIKEAKWGDTSVLMHQKLDEAEQASREVTVPEPTRNQPPRAHAGLDPVQVPPAYANTVPDIAEQEYVKWLPQSPAMAVIRAWEDIEGMLRELGTRHGVPGTILARSANHISQKLTAMNVLEPTVANWLIEMRQVRNAAAHAKEVTETDALRFLELAKKVRVVLKQL
jgi:hypothetical protein